MTAQAVKRCSKND